MGKPKESCWGEDEETKTLRIKRTLRDLPLQSPSVPGALWHHSCWMARVPLLEYLSDGELSSFKATSCIINQILPFEGASYIKWKAAS